MIRGGRPGRSDGRTSPWGIVLLAALAYLPALFSSPGRMPADTKLYLYLDPGGLVGRAASTFEPDQFAGWVPHQQITYLWPSGPWFWLFDTAGVPDWVAHRLWIGTILFAAGTGVRWAARWLGLGPAAALVAAAVYQLSPYLLPYVSRTSLLLLPWAGLGWIIGLVVRATADGVVASDERRTWRTRLRPWRDPALIALVVATVGSVNATALALIAPAPVLWLLHVGWQRTLPWRTVVGVGARTAALCTAVSAWWIAMLLVQADRGAPVLAFSETLTDVSRNATGSEVLRGLGYWLFYQRNPIGPTTTASFDYLVSVRTMVVSYLVVIAGIAGLAAVHWAQRRFAALCVAVGMVLAVGVHPIDDPSPLMRWFTGDDGSGLALALRSSTRATPVLLLGVALGAGTLLSIVPDRVAAVRRRVGPIPLPFPRQVLAAGLVLLAVVNLPSLWRADLVDPAIDRDAEVPDAWNDAADTLDADGHDGRVLQVPGAEFGAFRWGYTVDQPLVALTDDPVVTRDLLPLGSAAAMDLLYALDDRFQEEVAEPEAVAPVARLLGVDTIWLANDLQFERFGTPRPEVVDGLLGGGDRPAGLGDVERFGTPVANDPTFPIVDPETLVEPAVGEPVSPVALVTVDEPGTIVRAKTAEVVVSGSGGGIVDAAAAGLVSGHELVRYSGSFDDTDLPAALDEARLLVVTDSNRDRAHHWRGSQDVVGHTEPGGPEPGVLVETPADQRLQLFDDDEALQTVAVQVGPVTAQASSYGEPFAYRPEARAVMGIDGDPSTAWSVGDHGDPIGEFLRLTVDGEVGSAVRELSLRQVDNGPGGRAIDTVRIAVDDTDPLEVRLDAASFEPGGQTVPIPSVSPGESFDIEIASTVDGDPALAASRAGVGFVEIDLGVGSTTEFVRPPLRALAVDTDTPTAVVLTRLRTSATDPWRSDPEPELRRLLEFPDATTLRPEITLRLDRRASDDTLVELLAPALDGEPAVATSRVTGGTAQWGAAAVDGDADTAWVTPFDGAVGAALTVPVTGRLGEELVVEQPDGPYSPVTALRLSAGADTADLMLTPDDNGTWRSPIPPALAEAASRSTVTATITAIDPRITIDRRYGDPITLPAAISELTATSGLDPATLDRSATISADCRDDLLMIDGEPLPLSFSTTADELLAGQAVTATACDAPIVVRAGELLIESDSSAGLSTDRLVLREATVPSPAPAEALVAVDVRRDEPRRRTVEVAPCPDGCWVVLGEGYNPAWTATVGGFDLGAPTLVDGGFNGWQLPPGDSPTVVEFRWTAQGPVTWGLGFSLAAVLACLAMALGAPRPRPSLLPRPRRPSPLDGPAPRALAAGVTLIILSGLLIGAEWAAVALVPTGAALLAPRWRPSSQNWVVRRPFAVTGLVAAITVGVWATAVLRRDRPFPDAGWTFFFDHLNGLAVFATLALAVGAAFASDADESTARRGALDA